MTAWSMTGLNKLNAERAMFRDQDSYRSQKSYHGEDAETETHLPAVLEGQSQIIDVQPLSTEGETTMSSRRRAGCRCGRRSIAGR